MQRFNILDIDGTLMPSHHIDNKLYWQAVSEVFQIGLGTLDLHRFSNVTDNGILTEWCDGTLGRAPKGAELIAVRSRFLDLLKIAAKHQPASFTPFPGAIEWLAQQTPGTVALATGGWEHTARFKLSQAGIDQFKLPLASSDQAANRTGIMRHALDRLGASNLPNPNVVTYFGDGPWDLAAATVLGWNFIGIAKGQRATILQQAGAAQVLADFRPLLTT